MKTQTYNASQISYFKRLNRLLKKNEKELIARCIVLNESYNSFNKKSGKYRTDFDLEVIVTFNFPGNKSRSFWTWAYPNQIIKKSDGIAYWLGPEGHFIEKEKEMSPQLNEKICYFLYWLLFRANISERNIYTLVNVWFSVQITEGKCLRLQKND